MEITQALEEVCTLMPSSIKAQCVTVINTYGPYVIELMAQEMKPDEICKAIGLCKTASNIGETEFFLRNIEMYNWYCCNA